MTAKRLLLLCGMLCAALLAGCGTTGDVPPIGEQGVTFTGLVEEVGDGYILVSTEDDVSFDRANVRFAEGFEPDFQPEVGQLLRITILPEMSESCPVQVTATAMAPITDIELSPKGVQNVSMSAKQGSVTPTSLTLVITDGNDVPYTYGEWYALQVKRDGEWAEVPVIAQGNFGFNDIGLLPDEDGVLTLELDWEWLYGALAPGEYRVVKSLYFMEGYRYLYAEFAVTEADSDNAVTVSPEETETGGILLLGEGGAPAGSGS